MWQFCHTWVLRQTSGVNIEAVIAALDGRYDADETEVIERVLREYNGTIPDQQLIEEAALALAILRRQTGTGVG